MIVDSSNPLQLNEFPASKLMPEWLIFLELACASIAMGLWYFLPQVGGWPLVLAIRVRENETQTITL